MLRSTVAASRSASPSVSAQTTWVARIAIGLVVRRGRLEIVAVEPHCLRRIEIGEVMREGKRRTNVSGELCAVVRRAKQINRRQRHVRRHRTHIVKRMAGREGARFK